ncbi:MAG: response regulator transcription factor [Acidobacteriota bacterium]|nr:response regulator transcription factor [Acidobacteriota bacterium]
MLTKTEGIRILIADDHPIVRRGLRQVIESDPGLKVVAEAADGEVALAQLRGSKPDIAVLDLDMPKLDGFGVAREIGKTRLPIEIVFLTIHGEEDLFHAAMDLGAKGYILKESALTEIVQGLRAVAAGQHYLSPSLTQYLFDRRRRTESLAQSIPRLEDLTETERRILRAIADYRSSKDIGSELCIHFRTVENHRTAICHKLGLRGTNSLLKFALQHKTEL